MYCKKCGADNKDNARFCCKCGEPIEIRDIPVSETEKITEDAECKFDKRNDIQ